MSSCLVIGASKQIYRDGRYDHDYMICADGGLDSALALGLSPDVVIGDGDSSHITTKTIIDTRIERITLPREKDETDLEAAVRLGLDRGFKDFCLTGCTGGRLDHFLSALFLLEFLAENNAKGRIADADNEIILYSAPVLFSPPHGFRYFSVIPLDETLRGVCVSGAKYGLENATLKRGASLPVSNEFLPGTAAKIEIGQGKAFVIRSEREHYAT